MWKRVALGLFLLLGGTIAAKTALFAPSSVATASDISLAPIPDFDLNSAAAHLGQAIKFQTVSHQLATDNDPSQWTALQSWMQTAFPAAHAAMEREVLANGTLIYRWLGEDTSLPAIILMAHQDVVPVTPGTEKDWKHPPFEGRIADGAVWGRGAVDDKGSLITLFEAADALARSGFRPRRTLYLVSGHDEEVGGTGAKEAAALFAKRGIKALFTIDEGSVVITDAPVIDQPAILIGVAEKGYGTLRVVAKAPGGHSSMPPAEIGSVRLAEAIIAIHKRQFLREVHPPVTGMIETLADRKGGLVRMAAANQWLFGSAIRNQIAKSPAGAAMLHTTIAPTMLEGSPKENVLPQTATALINYRIAPWQRSKDVMAAAKQAVGTMPVSLSWVSPPREPSPVSSTTSLGWKLVRAAAESEAKGAVVSPFLVVGGTDSRSFSGVSQDVYRFAPAQLSSHETTMIHGTNEHMTIENLGRMVRFYARLIATAAG